MMFERIMRFLGVPPATDGLADTDRCDAEVYAGNAVAVATGLSKHECELLCSRLRRRTKQRVDWHYVAGRPVIKVHRDDDRDKVQEALASEGVHITSAGIPASY